MTRVALWLRVSDPDQHTENQQPDLESFVARKKWDVGPVYEVQESAWRGAHLKVLSQVYQDARLGRFDVLVVWALDRLSRQGVAATFEIVNQLARNGARVVSVMESWTEQEGPMYDLLLSVFAWVAQYESLRRSERTKAGMFRARAQGKQIGRPKGSADKRKRKRSGYFRRYSDNGTK